MLERFKKNFKVRLGLAPTRRFNFSETAFRLDWAKQHKTAIETKLNEMGIEFVNIDFLNEEGLIYAGKDAKAVADYFKEQEIDALFIPHVNLGWAIGRRHPVLGALHRHIRHCPLLYDGRQHGRRLPDYLRM